jgi:hypothetical protein
MYRQSSHGCCWPLLWLGNTRANRSLTPLHRKELRNVPAFAPGKQWACDGSSYHQNPQRRHVFWLVLAVRRRLQ